MSFAETKKNSLSLKLLRALEFRKKALESSYILDAMGVTDAVTVIPVSTLFETIINRFCEDILKSFRVHYQTTDIVSIDLDPKYYSFNKTGVYNQANNACIPLSLWRKLREVDSLDIGEQKELVYKTINAIPFNEIHSIISLQIHNQDKRVIAEILPRGMEALNVMSNFQPPKVTESHFIFHNFPINSRNIDDHKSKYSDLKTFFKLIENETDLLITPSINEFVEYINALPPPYLIESRAVFGKRSHVQITCFKSKTEIKISSKLFDSLLAFVSIHGTEDMQNSLFDLLTEKINEVA